MKFVYQENLKEANFHYTVFTVSNEKYQNWKCFSNYSCNIILRRLDVQNFCLVFMNLFSIEPSLTRSHRECLFCNLRSYEDNIAEAYSLCLFHKQNRFQGGNQPSWDFFYVKIPQEYGSSTCGTSCCSTTYRQSKYSAIFVLVEIVVY